MQYATATDSKESHFCKVIMVSERGRPNKSIIIMPICMRSSSISGQKPQSIRQDKVMARIYVKKPCNYLCKQWFVIKVNSIDLSLIYSFLKIHCFWCVSITVVPPTRSWASQCFCRATACFCKSFNVWIRLFCSIMHFWKLILCDFNDIFSKSKLLFLRKCFAKQFKIYIWNIEWYSNSIILFLHYNIYVILYYISTRGVIIIIIVQVYG